VLVSIPVGDILRSLLPRWKWLGIFRGMKITTKGGTEILLDQGNVPPLRGSQFDSKPHSITDNPGIKTWRQ
jgi:hypothetical protein